MSLKLSWTGVLNLNSNKTKKRLSKRKFSLDYDVVIQLKYASSDESSLSGDAFFCIWTVFEAKKRTAGSIPGCKSRSRSGR